ncbi:hypothetical protein U1Q18_041613 [Sarracenia purpurea var. burkii]
MRSKTLSLSLPLTGLEEGCFSGNGGFRVARIRKRPDPAIVETSSPQPKLLENPKPPRIILRSRLRKPMPPRNASQIRGLLGVHRRQKGKPRLPVVLRVVLPHRRLRRPGFASVWGSINAVPPGRFARIPNHESHHQQTRRRHERPDDAVDLRCPSGDQRHQQ